MEDYFDEEAGTVEAVDSDVSTDADASAARRRDLKKQSSPYANHVPKECGRDRYGHKLDEFGHRIRKTTNRPPYLTPEEASPGGPKQSKSSS